MTYTNKYDTTIGIVISKIPYNDYHEIINILDDSGNIVSYFYENVNKNRKKLKISIPCEVNVVYFATRGMRKIISLDVSNYYKNIINDLEVSGYTSLILELVSSDIENNYYNVLSNILLLIDENKIDYQLGSIYFSILYLKHNGFLFKYKKIDREYKGFSFEKNMFVDIEETIGFFSLSDRLVKLLYVLSTGKLEILENIFLEVEDYKILFKFVNTILMEYLGVYVKSYNKIIELEKYTDFFRGEK